MQTKSEHIGQIDALRGIAAFGVAFIFHQHFLHGAFRSGPLDGLFGFTWLHRYGWTLVDLFFVISGFVFSHVYLNAQGLVPGTTARNFAIARFATLYPLHLLTLVIVAALYMAGKPANFADVPDDLFHFVLNIFMLQESGLNNGMSFNIPTWSVSVEIICYILFYIAARLGNRIFWLFAAGAVFISVLSTIFGLPSNEHFARGICGFFIGCIIWKNRIALSTIGLELLIAFAIFILATGIQIPHVSYGIFLSLTAWPALLLAAMKIQLLNSSPFRWLGNLSYSIYLIHAPVYVGLNIFVFSGDGVPEDQRVMAVVFAVACTLLLSHLSYYYAELPARKWIRSYLDRGQRPQGLAVQLNS